ncbi:hypothetical protein NA57DRAFT_71772 [Rhizodiscina lignyota]|uniref:Uncharacterized protein n=1 Tax=Rhizodiscina lignyota TaxID=1504668 RepID=A0A9P4IN03_9PEZI|nr:hypothetical protein NA57DRAFT_71772 [Rhizodiscina lignyota]
MAVATNNGLVNLEDHEFKLLYSRREDRDDHLIARIVAIKDGVIDAKIEPLMDGEDQVQAFKALRKDVEIKLDRLLQQIPDRNFTAAGPSTTSTTDATNAANTTTSTSENQPRRPRRSGTGAVEAPPAYESTDVDMTARKS